MTMLQSAIVLLPLTVFGLVRRSGAVLAACLLTLALNLIQALVLYAPSAGWLATLKYNWLQKGVMFFATLFLCRILGGRWKDCGLAASTRWSCFAVAIVLGLVLGLPEAVQTLRSTGHSAAAGTEALLFELTMPGLQEEPLYRGLMLWIWDRALGTPWKALGVRFGVGCLISTAAFATGHLVLLNKSWQVVFIRDPLAWIDLIVFSLSMCWLRYWSASVWPAVVAHNAGNELDMLATHLPPAV